MLRFTLVEVKSSVIELLGAKRRRRSNGAYLQAAVTVGVVLAVFTIVLRPSFSVVYAATVGDSTPRTERAAVSPSLVRSRDRLLGTLAKKHQISPSELWERMSESERGVFLTITDLLGNRSPLENGPLLSEVQALDHVVSIVRIRGQSPSQTCGGKRWSRMFVIVSDRLLEYLRYPERGLPTWRKSRDGFVLSLKLFWWVGPHAPFDQSAETFEGRPRGQAHFWSAAARAKGSRRVSDDDFVHPNTVEFDLDYNLRHDSSPSCTYGSALGPVTGITRHHMTWASRGNATDPDWDYRPGSSLAARK